MPKRKGGQKGGTPKGSSSSSKKKKARVSGAGAGQDIDADYYSSSSSEEEQKYDGYREVDTDIPQTHDELDELLQDEERLLLKLQNPSPGAHVWRSLQQYCGFKYSGTTYKSDMIRCGGVRGPAVKFQETNDIRLRFLKYGIPRDTHSTSTSTSASANNESQQQQQQAEEEEDEVKARMELELWVRRAPVSGNLHHDARAHITKNGYQYMFEKFDADVDDSDATVLTKSYGGNDPIKLRHNGTAYDLLTLSSPTTNRSSRRSRSSRRGTRAAAATLFSAEKDDDNRDKDNENANAASTPTTKTTYNLQEYRDYLRRNPSYIKRADIDDPNQLLALEMWVASSPTPLPTFEFSNDDDDDDDDDSDEEGEEEEGEDRKPAAKEEEDKKRKATKGSTQQTASLKRKKKKATSTTTTQQQAAVAAAAASTEEDQQQGEEVEKQQQEEESFFQKIISPFKWFLGSK